MNKIKVIILFIIFVSLSVGNSGCKNDNKKEKEVIKIGAILPLTGNASVAGTYSKNGLLLAVEEINKNGGINGKNIILEIEDSKGDPKEGVIALQKLNASPQIPVLIYAQLSSVCLALKPITEGNKQLLFGVSGSEILLKNSNYVYRNYVDPEIIGYFVGRILKDSLKAKNIGIFFSNNDFGLSVNSSILSNIKGSNVSHLFSESFDEHNLEYKNLIQKSIRNNPEYVYIVGIGRSLGIFIKQLKESGFKGQILGGLETPFPDVLNIAGSYASGIQYVDLAYDNASTDEATKRFIEKYKINFNELPQAPSAVAYDATTLFLQALGQGFQVSDFYKINNYDGVFGKVKVEDQNFQYELKLKTIK